MTDSQWEQLLDVIDGKLLRPLPVGFIVDCPWLPGWMGVDVSYYLANETVWFEANRKAVTEFPEVWFFPGFWAEFGMCTEPSAFGAKCTFPRDEFPFPKAIVRDLAQIDELEEPDPETDGLLPLVLNRLKWARPHIENLGHKIRFSVSRGPLNVAAFVLGATEFMLALKTEPARIHRLLDITTEFLCRWHRLQKETFPTIDGIMVLDDVVGMLGEADFREFAFPYLKRVFSCIDVRVRFFHNDAPCAQSARYYPELGINLLNPGFRETLSELRRWTNDAVVLMGNVPPRDVLAAGTPAQVRDAVTQMLDKLDGHHRLIVSCGGGVPPGVRAENIRAMLEAVRQHTS